MEEDKIVPGLVFHLTSDLINSMNDEQFDEIWKAYGKIMKLLAKNRMAQVKSKEMPLKA